MLKDGISPILPKLLPRAALSPKLPKLAGLPGIVRGKGWNCLAPLIGELKLMFPTCRERGRFSVSITMYLFQNV